MIYVLYIIKYDICIIYVISYIIYNKIEINGEIFFTANIPPIYLIYSFIYMQCTHYDLHIYGIVPQISFIFADIQSSQISAIFLTFFIHRSIEGNQIYIKYFNKTILRYMFVLLRI